MKRNECENDTLYHQQDDGSRGTADAASDDGWNYLWRAHIGLFSDYSCDPDGNLSAVWQKMPGEHDDLCQRRSDHCCNGLDFLVTCRCTSICTQQKYSKLCGCFFETVSGFTTTGSTILTEIEGLPKGILFWRSLTHWVGGMGVLVFVMVLTSLDEKNSMHLMRAEVPGPEADKLVPKARGTARILYGMYFALTAIEVVFLLAGGMNLFDAVTHAFSTAGTGGFSGYNASVAHFNSAYIDGVITVFMILFGINFNLYFFLLLKEFKSVFKNEELRAYLGIIAGATVVITCNIAGGYHSLLKAFRYAAFQVASVITTTGFVTADFNKWPELSKCVLLLVMVIGASAGSTGGGIKVSRLLILVKSIRRELKTMIHPKAVNIVKVNGKKVKEETMRGVYVYFIAYILILIVSVLLISINNFDFTTSFTGVLTTLNNVGPGLNLVGPVENFAKFSDFSKIVFCVDMLIGRLEIFPFLMLFSPSLWSRKF